MKDFSAKAYKDKLKKQGVFHTDTKLAKIIKAYGKARPKNVYDPTCGVGTLLSVFDDDIPKYGQEMEADYLEVAQEVLKNFTGALGDTLKEPAFMDKRFDLIVANYPFSVKWEPDKEDVRFKDWVDVPPPSKADYAFIMHMLYLLADDGLCVTLNFPGILYRKAREGKIRQDLVDKGYVKKVVQVPGGYFEDTNIQTAILVLSKAKSDGYILFEDLELGMQERVPIEEVKDNGYILSVSSYVQKEIPKMDIDPLEVSKAIRQETVKGLESKLAFDLMDASLQYTALGNQKAYSQYLEYLGAIIDTVKGFVTKTKELIDAL